MLLVPPRLATVESSRFARTTAVPQSQVLRENKKVGCLSSLDEPRQTATARVSDAGHVLRSKAHACFQASLLL